MYKKGTMNYNFPQWDYSEHPDFLDDINPAWDKIDKVMHRIEVESADSADAIATLTPVVEGLTEDVKNAKHDITDLQTRCTNLEHDNVTNKDAIDALQRHDADIDKTLTGYDETHPVINDIIKINEQIATIPTVDNYIFDGVARATNKRVGDLVVSRVCTKTTVLVPDGDNIVVATLPKNATIFETRAITKGTELNPDSSEDVTRYMFYVPSTGEVKCMTQSGENAITIYATIEYVEGEI